MVGYYVLARVIRPGVGSMINACRLVMLRVMFRAVMSSIFVLSWRIVLVVTIVRQVVIIRVIFL